VSVHVPILLEPIVQALLEPFRNLPASSTPYALVDCTLGGGGHTSAFLKAFAEDSRLSHHKVVSIDQDPVAVAAANSKFQEEIAAGKLILLHSRFGEAVEKLTELNLPILGMMADLGFSSDQLEDADRGLSFQWDGPLDMRLDPTRDESAKSFLQKVTIKELETILSELGEERYSKTVAAAIIQSRRDRQLPDTTKELAELITRSVPPPARHLRIHPATRTFQALRIHVNEELKELDRLLERVIILLQTGGRAAILSFHSLEDRRVKIAFKGESFRALTKKPVEADEEEIRINPRSRSAKLRVAQKI
jgi:16S rRNA (cytosine1402-N4)-methyltransferase